MHPEEIIQLLHDLEDGLLDPPCEFHSFLSADLVLWPIVLQLIGTSKRTYLLTLQPFLSLEGSAMSLWLEIWSMLQCCWMLLVSLFGTELWFRYHGPSTESSYPWRSLPWQCDWMRWNLSISLWRLESKSSQYDFQLFFSLKCQIRSYLSIYICLHILKFSGVMAWGYAIMPGTTSLSQMP